MKLLNEKQRKSVINYFLERFGIDSHYFDSFELIEQKNRIHILAKSRHLKGIDLSELYEAGMLLLADKNEKIPSNMFLVSLKRNLIKKNFLVLKKKQVELLRKKKKCSLRELKLNQKPANGFAAIVLKKQIVGSAKISQNFLELNSGSN